MEQQNVKQTSIEPASAAPISATERFHSMDMLRGVAVLGILVMNIYAFAMPFAAYNNPLIMGGTDTLNMAVWYTTHLIFDQKFLAIFAMLYGAGLIMMMDRAIARGAKFGRIFYRRSVWLLLFGLAHGAFIWFGDILFGYALTGMLIYLFRNKSPKTLIISGVVFLVIGISMTIMGSSFMQQMKAGAQQAEILITQGEEPSEELLAAKEQWDANRPFMAPNAEDIQKDVDTYKGDYTGILDHRIPEVAGMQLSGTLFFILWRAGGLMLLGMGLMRLGIMNGQREPAFYRTMMLYGYGIGFPVMFYSAYDLTLHDFDNFYFFGWGMLPNYWGSLFVCLGHIGLVNYLYKSGALSKILESFSYVGRMAFSNYLGQSIILTSVFYGYGFNLYSEIPRIAQMGFVVAVILFQLWFSKWWLMRYRFGPAEWLWRSLTYWKKQPFQVK